MTSSASFQTFKTYCTDALNGTDYEEYCETVRQKAETAAEWAKWAAQSSFENSKWYWQKTGEHYGEKGQALLVVLVACLAYNIFGGKKKKKEAGPPPCSCHRGRRHLANS